MTMELQLGLVGWDMAGTARPIPPWSDGDQLDLNVEYLPETYEDARAIRAQVLGYNGQNAVVPLRWSLDDTLDGYYRIVGATVANDHALYLANRVVATFNLQRIRGYSSPIIESVYTGAARSFVTAGTVLPWTALPNLWASENEALGWNIADTYRRLDAVRGVRVDIAPGVFSRTVLSSVPPANFYDGSVLFRSGPTLAVQTGRHHRSDPNWEIDNGLVKISGAPDDAAMFALLMRLEDGTGWATRTRTITVTDSTQTPNTFDWDHVDPVNVNLLRNSPEEVVLSLRYPVSVYTPEFPIASAGAIDVRVSVRRGARVVAISVSSNEARRFGLRFVTGFAGAGTAFSHGGGAPNYGVIETTAGSDGLRSVVFQGSDALSFSGGSVRAGASTNHIEAAFGAQVDFSAAEEQPDRLLGQYLAAQAEVQRVVAR